MVPPRPLSKDGGPPSGVAKARKRRVGHGRLQGRLRTADLHDPSPTAEGVGDGPVQEALDAEKTRPVMVLHPPKTGARTLGSVYTRSFEAPAPAGPQGDGIETIAVVSTFATEGVPR